MKSITGWLGWIWVLALAGMAVGSEITSEQAGRAARNWVARGHALGQISAERGVEGVDEVLDSGTGARLWVVRLEGGGFVVTSGDDQIEPILAFSEGGDTLVADEANPLWVLLRGDIAARTAECGGRSGGRETRNGERSASQRRWDALLGAGEGSRAAVALKTVPDIRVASFVKSLWDQEKVNGEYCWNYYTPGPPKTESEPSGARGTNPDEEEDEEGDHYPCGCTATALAQIMRHYQWPHSYSRATGRRCFVDGVETNADMIGTGFSWSKMPLRPKAMHLTEEQREAMGRLTYNIGVSRHMNWKRTGGGSGASTIGGGKGTLVDDFGYSSAVDINYGSNYSWSLAEFKKAVIPNFDARSPVALSLPGHAVLADGYGYSGGNFWIHVNMGWGGTSDAWYCPPDIENYTAIDGLVCNIFPQKSGNIVSGRVLDTNGTPVAGAVVVIDASSAGGGGGAKAAGGARAVASGKSDGRGIYALVVPGEGEWTVRATAGGVEASVEAKTTVTKGIYDASSCLVGNTYDNDIVLGASIQAQCIVTLDPQGGSGGTEEVAGTFGLALPTIVPPTKGEGYSFGGYWSEEDGMGIQYHDADGRPIGVWNQLEDATLYANWEAGRYKAQYVYSEEDGWIRWCESEVVFGEYPDVPSSVKMDDGTTVSLANLLMREGYVFRGYWTGRNGTGTQYVSEKRQSIRAWDIAADTMLYPKWEGVKSTVTLDVAGGHGGTESVTATYGSVLPTVTPPEKDGWEFAGYYEGTGGTGTQWYGANGAGVRKWASTEGATLHAHWVEAGTGGGGNGDSFAQAVRIAGGGGSAAFSNVGAGKETLEPVHSSLNYPGGASVWALWVAPSDGDWTLWLEGTAADGEGELDTQLAVYTGTEVGALTRIAANDDTPEGGYSSRLSFHVSAGTTYRIAMDTYRGAEGVLTLRWEEGIVHYAKFKVEFDYPVRFVPRSGGRVEVGVDSSGAWQLVESSALVDVETETGANGDVFVCAMGTNATGAERTGTASIRSGDSEPATLTLRQHPMDFVTTKADAVARALAENRRVLLVRGREACWNTRTTLFSSVPTAAVKQLVEGGYVLWYSNCDRQSDGREYAVGDALPTVAILDPQAMGAAVAATNGFQTAEQLQAFLTKNAEWGGLLAVDTATLEDAVAGTAYRAELAASGGIPPYAWGEVAGRYEETSVAESYAETGTSRGWKADDGCWELALPFAFPFFGNDYTNAKVNSNGAISFGDENFTAYAYSEAVFGGAPILAVLWRDLTTAGGDIFVEEGSGWVKIRWRGVYYDGGAVNFSATLHRAGKIVLSYGAGNAAGGVVGLSAGDGKTMMFSAKSGGGSLERTADIVFEPQAPMPSWLSLSGGGVLAGVPPSAGAFAVPVMVTDSRGVSVSRTLTLVVRTAGGGQETENTPVRVPYSWLEEKAAEILAANGGDYEAAAMATAANGWPVWQCYLTGVGVTNATAAFRMKSITVVDGVAKVTWEPDLNEGGTKRERVYTVEGKRKMTDPWGNFDEKSRFFRVKVEME